MEPGNETIDEQVEEARVEKDETDHSAAAVLERESAKKDRAEYVHPEGARDYRVEGNDIRDYVGVDPEYMTYANPTDAPMLTDTERYDQTTQYDHLEGNADELDGDVEGNHTPESDAEKQAHYEELRAQGLSEAEASEEVWPSSEAQDSEPGNAGETPSPNADPKLGKESQADPEISPSGFTPFS